jgi:hypothetical protein
LILKELVCPHRLSVPVSVLTLLDNPLVNYLIRLQKIYTLDLEVLDRLIALLKGVNVEVSSAYVVGLGSFHETRSQLEVACVKQLFESS